MMLKQVFGCRTYAKHYHPLAPTEVTRAISEASGGSPLDGAWPQAYARMTESNDLYLVKTHDPPDDNARAVYLARNGFAAVISYQCLLREARQQQYSLEDIILGKPLFGSWGGHLDAWQPFDRPNTLLLTYEDLMQNPDEQIRALGEFCSLRPEKEWVNEFDKFHALHPTLFRKGRTDDASSEFSRSDRDLFWSLHGDWMQRLGYAKHFDSAQALPQLRRALMNRPHSSPSGQSKPETKTSPVRRAIAGLFRKPRLEL